ncbi:hypothetical protein WICMUC_003837 [Wickerhamomyces mucosus]|uniref:Uncharacterized protein n=1 Tax=Wickerhamomyces mucosus TaxID=1378264 RepID=A0A9P8TC22_9ASCO|nr:hypothetical protein WICMUC_003837 [Wickerhamomyces mucosus]
MYSLIAVIAASRHNSFKSEPLNPMVFVTIKFKSKESGSTSESFRFNVKIRLRCSSFGNVTENLFGILLKKAASMSFGLLVAPSTKILPEDVRPSHRVMNSAFNIAVTSWSIDCLSLKNESISSMNIIQGCNLPPSEKIASTILFDSPYHLSIICDILIEMKFAPLSLASALASIVFPQPGGPYNKTPFGAFNNELKLNNSGLF